MTPQPGEAAPRRRTTTALALLLAAALAGCSAPDVELTGIEQLPLPGGADLGDHPYQVTAEFADVLSLVPQSAVKVNDVAVGRVTRITLDPGDWSATVTMKVDGDVRLPANAHARLEQSSLLGEKYVQLTAPAEPRGTLADGARIPADRTDRNPEVEEVFGALSMVLNGGGIQQLRTIAGELGTALGGNETEIRSLLTRINTLVAGLDGNKQDITAALDGVNRLSATLATRRQDVGAALTGLSPGLKVLEEQRGRLLTMLRALDTLSTVAVDTVDRAKDDMVADLKALGPTLTALADAGKALPDSLQVLLTYPFTDEVLRGVKGDYLNVYLDLTAVPGTRIVPALTPDDEADGGADGAAPPPGAPPAEDSPARTTPGGSGPGDAARPGSGALPPLPLPSAPRAVPTGGATR
ncbi:virulence factor Mce family protein Precursor [Streptomyces solincola]|uniref:Virulence factor Mce family protein n=1 Tax=Streptomyces solincola TaxID=2100817 RepID=A0A2S9PQK9_9ACTN|nr:MCE family protein [Streptomyces solincola]PRH76682.1 virulence factor Mce family protein Precursor [Streptomyces solincola]